MSNNWNPPDPDDSLDTSIDKLLGLNGFDPLFEQILTDFAAPAADPPTREDGGSKKYMTFIDETNHLRKRYDAAGTNLITIGQLDGSNNPKTYYGLYPRDGTVEMDALKIASGAIDGTTAGTHTGRIDIGGGNYLHVFDG